MYQTPRHRVFISYHHEDQAYDVVTVKLDVRAAAQLPDDDNEAFSEDDLILDNEHDGTSGGSPPMEEEPEIESEVMT